jgi:hypothetical protein
MVPDLFLFLSLFVLVFFTTGINQTFAQSDSLMLSNGDIIVGKVMRTSGSNGMKHPGFTVQELIWSS